MQGADPGAGPLQRGRPSLFFIFALGWEGRKIRSLFGVTRGRLDLIIGVQPVFFYEREQVLEVFVVANNPWVRYMGT